MFFTTSPRTSGIKQTCLRIQPSRFTICGINAPRSSMQALLSGFDFGTMAPSNTVLVAGAPDMAETLEGFAQQLQALAR